MVNVVVVVRGMLFLLPFTAGDPVQLPFAGLVEAVHPVTLVVSQVRFVVPPEEMVVGLAVNVSVGGEVVTVTMRDWLTIPPGPEQERLKVVVAFNTMLFWLPFTAGAPFHDPVVGLEVAVQLVTLAVVQVRFVVPPAVMVVGLALKVNVGAGGGAAATVTVLESATVPPEPRQERLKVVVCVSTMLFCVPLTAGAPFQAPVVGLEVAAQLVALVVDQVRFVVAPLVMLVGLASKLSVGGG